MEGEQHEIQFLGFFGIFKEAFNITTSHRKIFSQITVSVILPLSFIFLAQNEISESLLGKSTPDKNAMDDTQMGFKNYSSTSSFFSSEWTTFLLFMIPFFIVSIILHLLSTSAVVYTIACIYTAKEITYRKVMKVVPKVWKRLMITFLWNFIIALALIMGGLLVTYLCVVTLGPSATVIAVAIIFLLIYLSVVVYFTFVWQLLASIISVLEDVYGIQAMLKSKNLIKGKTRVCAAIYLIYSICFLGADRSFKASVVGVDSVWGKIFYACLWSMIMSVLILFGLVIQTIIYFICKSYHHENIDKSFLADHLEACQGEYDPLDTKDVHIEHSMV
ncbi:ATP-binding cassette sub-family A member like [Heracleum sosnowskyi]|uniref:ATP-binding cassette sub-family A member like n=1 Tax=Heracleum sosnowskyi TaxID=360622 RepID=A0AAD8MY22_9APIA|nr:ATP-binding cassette sub-family A member like [Heracleum sosnowskyi]